VRVIELWRYPVKSMQGERMRSIEVTPLGFVGDRAWGVYDRASGLVLTARREPQLLFASARYEDGQVLVSTSDGEVLPTDRALSDWLGRDVELRRAGTRSGGKFEAPEDDFDEDAPWKTWEGPEGTFHDSRRARISIASITSFGEWDPRRFRVNVVLDGEGEEDWFGAALTVGTATVEVRRHIDRCVVVTRAQPGGIQRDLDVLKIINKEQGGIVGIGANVLRPGVVAVGDEVAPI
jgi:uncharacterized protein YcbX